jgi:hypothetical protein
MKLIINWNDFQNDINAFITKGIGIVKNESNTRDNNSFEEIKIEIDNWTKNCYNYLKKSFDDSENIIANTFIQEKLNFNLSMKLPILQQIRNEFIELKNRIGILHYTLKILGISDAIIKPDEIDLEIRKNYSTEDIIEFLLDKLYDLYDDCYYGVAFILEGNGIKLTKNKEEKQLINYLVENEYVITQNSNVVDAQLTLKGKIYVERKRKANEITYDGIENSKEEISNKIDELFNELNKLGLGQEVLFEELEDLKELYGTLNKTNWGKLLKGKLIDLGLAKTINLDTMKFVYEFLTKDILRLT